MTPPLARTQTSTLSSTSTEAPNSANSAETPQSRPAPNSPDGGTQEGYSPNLPPDQRPASASEWKGRPRTPNCSLLYPGDYLYLPSEPSCHFTFYEVEAGDSLQRLARRFGIKAKTLCQLEWNHHLRDARIPDRNKAWIQRMLKEESELKK